MCAQCRQSLNVGSRKNGDATGAYTVMRAVCKSEVIYNQ